MARQEITNLEKQETETGQAKSSGVELVKSLGLDRQLEEDPIFRFFAKYLKQVVIVAAAIFCFFFLKSEFQQSYEASMRDGAQELVKVRKEYATLLKNQRELEETKELAKTANEKVEDKESRQKKIVELDKSVEESKRKLNEYLTVLGDKKIPYPKIAKTYRALLAANDKDYSVLMNMTSEFSIKGKSDSDLFYSEMGSLLLGKSLLDSPDNSEQGKQMLLELAKNGQYAQVSAALTLKRIAETDQDKSEAKSLIDSIIAKHPEQSELLERD